MTEITPFLWFDSGAKEAAELYVSLFEDSHIVSESVANDGTTLVVEFSLSGRLFRAMNAGPQFPQTEAVSFMITADTQEEIDRYWDALTANGGEESMCGWLKDPWGVNWQVTPSFLMDMMKNTDRDKAARVNEAMLRMRKIILADLEAAAAG